MLPGRQPLGTGSWGSFYVILCCCCCLAAIVAPLLLLLPLPFAFGCAALSLLQDDDFPQIHKVFPFVTWQRAQHNKKKTITRCMQWQREREREIDRERERGQRERNPSYCRHPTQNKPKVICISPRARDADLNYSFAALFLPRCDNHDICMYCTPTPYLSLCLNIHIIGRRSFSARMRRLSQRSFSRFFIFMQLFVAFFLGFVFDICTFPFAVITQKLVLWRLLVLVFLPCNIIRFFIFIFGCIACALCRHHRHHHVDSGLSTSRAAWRCVGF